LASLRTKIVEQLRSDIVSGRAAAGELLLEKVVAARFDVSKTPAREALALLCEEGLVQLFPRRGYVVTGITVEQVMDTFDLRFVLEGAAAERAAVRMSDETLRQLSELQEHDCCDVHGVVSSRLETMRHSLNFHVLIARSSGNAMLAEQIEKLLRASRRVTSLGFVYGEHEKIIAALKARDGARARKAMEDHLSSGREAAMRMLGRPHQAATRVEREATRRGARKRAR
jgi:DNA-binding GntR family transcriptional regulator